MQISFVLVVLLFASADRLHAGWTLQSSERLGVSTPVMHIRKSVVNHREVTLHLVLFDEKKCALKVIDNPRDEGDLETAMREQGCLAGVNGNYFQPDRTPLGLVVSDGRTLHPFQRARLLTGVLAVTRDRISILRSAELKAGAKFEQALQAGPLLVDHGKPVAGLNDTRSAARTVVLTDARGDCALLVCDSVTLAEMARILSTPQIVTELKVTRALNLDGGSSTALWVREPPFYKREWKSVRNYLGVAPK